MDSLFNFNILASSVQNNLKKTLKIISYLCLSFGAVLIALNLFLCALFQQGISSNINQPKKVICLVKYIHTKVKTSYNQSSPNNSKCNGISFLVSLSKHYFVSLFVFHPLNSKSLFTASKIPIRHRCILI